METDPDTDGPIYLVEREEKMAGLYCASALVDQYYCRGRRNLRWDMIPAKIKNGVMHAKVSLLSWSNLLRLIISSANLTDDGYRKNQEVFAVLDYQKGGKSAVAVLTSIISYLRHLIRESQYDKEHPALKRWNLFLDKIAASDLINDIEELNSDKKGIKAYPVLVTPGGDGVLDQIIKYWQEHTHHPPEYAEIISPFYDPPESLNLPAKRIWGHLKKRGTARVVYKTRGEKIDHDKDEFILFAPETLRTQVPGNRENVNVKFYLIKEKVNDVHSNEEIIRPLHLKSLLLKNNNWLLRMVGSSNFTTPGLGMKSKGNYEANIAYLVNKDANQSEFKALENLGLSEIKLNKNFRFLEKPQPNPDEEPEGKLEVLPTFFESIIYDKYPNGETFIEMTFQSKDAPRGFEILNEQNKEVIYSEDKWHRKGKPLKVRMNWPLSPMPSGFLVKWQDSVGFAYWPIIVRHQEVLPPPPGLKDLPLEILIKIISSARPLHQMIKRWHKHQIKQEDVFWGCLDTHKRIDTHSFLLQRTRRISKAIYAFRKRLEHPVFTEETLKWRLYGPIGVDTFANALQKEACSDEERSFLMAEFALELSMVNPIEAYGSLKREVVVRNIKEVIQKLEQKAKPFFNQLEPDLHLYVKKAFRKAQQ